MYQFADSVITAKDIFHNLRLDGKTIKLFDRNDIKAIYEDQRSEPWANEDEEYPSRGQTRYNDSHNAFPGFPTPNGSRNTNYHTSRYEDHLMPRAPSTPVLNLSIAPLLTPEFLDSLRSPYEQPLSRAADNSDPFRRHEHGNSSNGPNRGSGFEFEEQMKNSFRGDAGHSFSHKRSHPREASPPRRENKRSKFDNYSQHQPQNRFNQSTSNRHKFFDDHPNARKDNKAEKYNNHHRNQSRRDGYRNYRY